MKRKEIDHNLVAEDGPFLGGYAKCFITGQLIQGIDYFLVFRDRNEWNEQGIIIIN